MVCTKKISSQESFTSRRMSTPTSAKKATLKLLERLDDDVTFEDIMYELHVLQKIERGLQDAEEERVTSHEDAKDRLDQWLK
jgi:hypothetical protein